MVWIGGSPSIEMDPEGEGKASPRNERLRACRPTWGACATAVPEVNG
jgi:hypothetical protein